MWPIFSNFAFLVFRIKINLYEFSQALEKVKDMFLLVSSRQICALQWDNKNGVSAQNFMNFGKIFSRVSRIRNIYIYIWFFAYQYLVINGFDFYFWWRDSGNRELSLSRFSWKKQPTFRDTTAGLLAKWSLLVLLIGNFLQPIRSNTQIWVVKRHQYGILRTFFKRHFAGNSVPAVVSV